MGANFVLQKPISALNARRCFSAAVNFMCASGGAISAIRWRCRPRFLWQGQKLKVSLTNLSEGGMAIFFRGRCPRAASPSCRSSCRGRYAPGTESPDGLDGRIWPCRSALRRYAQGLAGATGRLAGRAMRKDGPAHPIDPFLLDYPPAPSHAPERTQIETCAFSPRPSGWKRKLQPRSYAVDSRRIDRAQRLVRMLEQDAPRLAVRVAELTPSANCRQKAMLRN